MKIDITNEEGKVIVKVYGDIVASVAESFKEKAKEIESIQGLRVFMDLSEVAFIDSFGLRACMELHRALSKKGGFLVCYRMNDQLRKVFKLTRADKKISIAFGDRVQDGEMLIMTFPPLFAEVDRARTEIVNFCNAAYDGADVDEPIGDFAIAITEAMNNAAEHSKSDLVEVRVDASPAGIVFRMANTGDKFDPTENVHMPDMGDDDDLPEGGFGLAIIKELMDSVKYEYADGKNILTLEKKIEGKN